jgi:hypothetical protein
MKVKFLYLLRDIVTMEKRRGLERDTAQSRWYDQKEPTNKLPLVGLLY